MTITTTRRPDLDDLIAGKIQTEQAGLRRISRQQGQILRHALDVPRPVVADTPAARIRQRLTAARAVDIATLNALLGAIQPGRYALRRRDDGIDFFEVRRIGPDRSMIFRIHGAPGNFRRQTMNARLQALAALHLAENQGAAAALFGHAFRTCGVCGSPLTRPESREAGIGPKCRQRYGL